jgi:hypothetical protein
VEEWHPLFGDALLANAVIDRLLHNAHVVMMDGDTYRTRRRPRRRAAGTADRRLGDHAMIGSDWPPRGRSRRPRSTRTPTPTRSYAFLMAELGMHFTR